MAHELPQTYDPGAIEPRWADILGRGEALLCGHASIKTAQPELRYFLAKNKIA